MLVKGAGVLKQKLVQKRDGNVIVKYQILGITLKTPYVVGTDLNRLNETIQMSTHNIGCERELMNSFLSPEVLYNEDVTTDKVLNIISAGY